MSVLAASAMLLIPTGVLPVKLYRSIPGWLASMGPIWLPEPVTHCRTPSGKPASFESAVSFKRPRGLSIEGLTITALPIMRAGPTFKPKRSKGKLNGIIAASTPRGSRTVN